MGSMRLKTAFFFLIGVVFLCGCATNREAAKLFGNMTYFVGNEHFAESATLVNCEYHASFLNIYYDNRFVYGDFNHDGLRDAAVITVQNNGGNAQWYMLDFLINDGKALVHRASRELDDRAIINSMWQKNGKVFVDMYIHQSGDCMGGPTKRVKNSYEYTGPDVFGLGKKLWKSETDTRSYKPKRGLVPDELTAIKIAQAVLSAVYGEEKINEEKPLTADLYNGIWTVSGTSHCSNNNPCNGGLAMIGLQQDDGKILQVSH